MKSPFSVFPDSRDPQRERLFAELIASHGSMVFGVCRRILRRREDAEDACQAVFLVLARNGGALRDATRLAGWLHRVATRCAWKLHRKVSTRDRLEAPLELAEEPSHPTTASVLADEEWRTAIDAELDRLPSRYRLALVLCYLEGRSYMSAAAQLGLTHAGLKTRLERGRTILRERLIRRGLTGAIALAATDAFSAGFSPVAAATGWKTPSGNVIALSRAVHFRMALSSAATKLLPLAACIVTALMILQSPRTAAEPATPAPQVPQLASAPALSGTPAASANTPESSAAPVVPGTGTNAADYPYVIAWKKGTEDFANGNKIEITEVRGTKPTFELGNRYFVRGRYNLTGAARARLAFYITAAGLDGFSSGEEAGQTCAVEAGEGEFTLSRYFECAGDPHISFYDEKGSNIGGIYFSDGTPLASTPVQTVQTEPDKELWNEQSQASSIDTPRQPGGLGFDIDVMALKIRADEGDRTAALQLAEHELTRDRPNGIQAYRWFYVAGETARAAEILASLKPEERTDAERITAAYVQRPAARK